MEERSGEPDCKFAVPEKACCQRDQPSDERRLRKVTKRKLLGPDPVLRLVRVKIGRLKHKPKETKPGDCCHADEHCSSRRPRMRQSRRHETSAGLDAPDCHASLTAVPPPDATTRASKMPGCYIP